MGSSQSTETADSLEKGSESVPNLFCDICSEEEKVVEPKGFCVDCSDFLCKECFEAHTKTRASRNHVLHDKDHMPQQRPQAKDTCSDKCEVHLNETVKFYCRSHKTIGCGSCMFINHRKCDNVANITDLSGNLAESNDFKQFNKKLNFFKERSSNLITSSSAKKSASETCCSEAINSVKQLRTDFDNILGQLETDISTEAENLKSADTAKLASICDKAIQVLQEVEKNSSNMTSLQNKNLLNQVFIQMIKTKDKMTSWKKTLDEEESKNSVRSYSFKTSPEMLQIVKEQVFPGQLKFNA